MIKNVYEYFGQLEYLKKYHSREKRKERGIRGRCENGKRAARRRSEHLRLTREGKKEDKKVTEGKRKTKMISHVHHITSTRGHQEG